VCRRASYNMSIPSSSSHHNSSTSTTSWWMLLTRNLPFLMQDDHGGSGSSGSVVTTIAVSVGVTVLLVYATFPEGRLLSLSLSTPRLMTRRTRTAQYVWYQQLFRVAALRQLRYSWISLMGGTRRISSSSSSSVSSLSLSLSLSSTTPSTTSTTASSSTSMATSHSAPLDERDLHEQELYRTIFVKDVTAFVQKQLLGPYLPRSSSSSSLSSSSSSSSSSSVLRVGRIGPEDHLIDVTVLNDATAFDIVSLTSPWFVWFYQVPARKDPSNTTTGTTTSAEEEEEQQQHEEDIYRVPCLELARVCMILCYINQNMLHA
jgi:hypothetical protein